MQFHLTLIASFLLSVSAGQHCLGQGAAVGETDAPPTEVNDADDVLTKIRDEVVTLQDRLDSLPVAMAEAESYLQIQRARTPIEVAETEDAAELQGQRELLTEELRTIRQQLQRLDEEERLRNSRLQSIPEELADLQFSGVTTEPSAISPELRESRGRQLALEQRLATQSRPLLELKRKGALLAEKATAADLAIVEKRLEELEEASDTATAARISSLLTDSSLSPELRDVSDRLLATLAERSSGGRIESLSEAVDASSTMVANLQESLDNIEQQGRAKVSLLGSAGLPLDPSTGSLLRRHRDVLPPARSVRKSFLDGTSRAAELQILALDLAAKQSDILDPTFEANLLTTAGTESAGTAAEIVQSYRTEVGASLAEVRRLAAQQSRLNRALYNLAERGRDYRHFIDQHIVWVRNLPPLQQSLAQDLKGDAGLVDPSLWAAGSRAIVRDMGRVPVLWFLVVLITVGVAFRCRQATDALAQWGSAAAKFSCVDLSASWRSLFVTTILAFHVPLVLAFVGWRLAYSEDARPIGIGLLYGASVLLVGGFFWIASAKRGLLSHFNVAAVGLKRIRQTLAWATPTLALTVGAASLLVELPPTFSSGRLVFFLELVIVAAAAFHLLRPGEGLVKRHLIARSAIGLVLLGLFVLAFLGYYESALALRSRFFLSLCAFAAVLLLRGLCARGLRIAHRRELRAQFLRKRQANEALAEDPAAIARQEELEAEQLRLTDLSEQTATVIRFVSTASLVGLLFVLWSDQIPAVASLDNTIVWRNDSPAAATETLANDATSLLLPGSSATGAVTTAVEGQVSGVSLLDVLGAIAALIITLVLSRSLPALVEILFLRRFVRVAPGTSYASSTILRYIILTAGLLLCLRLVHFDWSSIQWIAAAATLGIGFGLQEIFGNFVSGIILLLERPVRLGDIVTVGADSGKVSSIRMRATTIVQFNNRELVIPNKALVTGNLVNWSLTDPSMRLELPVGVAYGSDTKRVKEILLEVTKHPGILQDPEPSVMFVAFADSSLNFVLRFYVTTNDEFMSIPSDLHFEIDERFRAEGIEIPFPQRTVHLAEPLPTSNPIASATKASS